jgi:DNA polymerase III delta prime subunit
MQIGGSAGGHVPDVTQLSPTPRLARLHVALATETEPAWSEMYEGFRNRLRDILAAEQVEYSDRVLDDLLRRCWPDFRQMLNQLQIRAA